MEIFRRCFQYSHLECDPFFENFKFANNYWTVSARAFILHMSVSCDKIFLLVFRYLSLWPWPSLELATIGGICVSRTSCFFFQLSSTDFRLLKLDTYFAFSFFASFNDIFYFKFLAVNLIFGFATLCNSVIKIPANHNLFHLRSTDCF